MAKWIHSSESSFCLELLAQKCNTVYFVRKFKCDLNPAVSIALFEKQVVGLDTSWWVWKNWFVSCGTFPSIFPVSSGWRSVPVWGRGLTSDFKWQSQSYFQLPV